MTNETQTLRSLIEAANLISETTRRGALNPATSTAADKAAHKAATAAAATATAAAAAADRKAIALERKAKATYDAAFDAAYRDYIAAATKEKR
jgi:hypothetical protein